MTEAHGQPSSLNFSQHLYAVISNNGGSGTPKEASLSHPFAERRVDRAVNRRLVIRNDRADELRHDRCLHRLRHDHGPLPRACVSTEHTTPHTQNTM